MADVTTYLANTRTGFSEPPIPGVPYTDLQPVVFPFSMESGQPFLLSGLEGAVPPNVFEFLGKAAKASCLRCNEAKMLQDYYEDNAELLTQEPYFPAINAPEPLKSKLRRLIDPANLTGLCLDTWEHATLGGNTRRQVQGSGKFAKEVAEFAATAEAEDIFRTHFHNGYLTGFSALVWHRNRFGEIDAWLPNPARTYISCNPADKNDITAIYAFSDCGRTFRFATKYAAGTVTRGIEPVIGSDVIVYDKPLPFVPVDIYRPADSKSSSNPYAYSPLRDTMKANYVLTQVKFARMQLVNWQTTSIMAVYATEPGAESSFQTRVEDMGFAQALIFQKDSKVEFVSPQPHLEAIGKVAADLFEDLANEQALPKTLFSQPDQPTATSSMITHSPMIMKARAIAKRFSGSQGNALFMLAAFLHFEAGDRPGYREIREGYRISVSIKTFMDMMNAANPMNVTNDLALLAAGAKRPVDMAADYNPDASPDAIEEIAKAIQAELDRKATEALGIDGPDMPSREETPADGTAAPEDADVPPTPVTMQAKPEEDN